MKGPVYHRGGNPRNLRGASWECSLSSKMSVGSLCLASPLTNLQKSVESDSEYMIHDNDPIVNKFVSVPKEMGSLDCAAFMAGIIKGMLDSAGFGAESEGCAC